MRSSSKLFLAFYFLLFNYAKVAFSQSTDSIAVLTADSLFNKGAQLRAPGLYNGFDALSIDPCYSDWDYLALTETPFILMNGLPVLFKNYIPLLAIGKININRNLGPAQYGPAANNGLISIEIAKPSANPLTRIALSTQLFDHGKDSYLVQSTFDYKRTTLNNLSFVHLQKIGKMDVLIGGSLFTSQKRFKEEINYNGTALTQLAYTIDQSFFKKLNNKKIVFGLNINSIINQQNSYIIDPSIEYIDDKNKSALKLLVRNSSFKKQSIYSNSVWDQNKYNYIDFNYTRRLNRIKANFNLGTNYLKLKEKHEDHKLTGFYFEVSNLEILKTKITIGARHQIEDHRWEESDRELISLNFAFNTKIKNDYFLYGGFKLNEIIKSKNKEWFRFSPEPNQILSKLLFSNSYGFDNSYPLISELGLKKQLIKNNFRAYIDIKTFYRKFRPIIELEHTSTIPLNSIDVYEPNIWIGGGPEPGIDYLNDPLFNNGQNSDLLTYVAPSGFNSSYRYFQQERHNYGFEILATGKGYIGNFPINLVSSYSLGIHSAANDYYDFTRPNYYNSLPTPMSNAFIHNFKFDFETSFNILLIGLQWRTQVNPINLYPNIVRLVPERNLAPNNIKHVHQINLKVQLNFKSVSLALSLNNISNQLFVASQNIVYVPRNFTLKYSHDINWTKNK